MKNFNRNNAKRLLRLVLSYSLVLFIILLMGLYLFHIGIEKAKNNLIKSNSTALAYAVDQIDQDFLTISSLSFQISNNKNIKNLIATDDINQNNFYLRALKIKNYLKELLPVQNMTFIDNLYIFFYDYDYIVSSNLLESSSLYYNNSKHYNKYRYKEYIDRISDRTRTETLQNLDTFLINEKSDELLYMLPVSPYQEYTERTATICFEINRAKFENTFSSLNIYNSGFIYVADKYNKEIFRITTHKSPQISSEQFNKKVENRSSNYNSITIGNEKMIVTSITSKNNLWTYYLVQPSVMAFEDLYKYQHAYKIGIIISLLIGIYLLLLILKILNPYIHKDSSKIGLKEEEIEQVSNTNNLAS